MSTRPAPSLFTPNYYAGKAQDHAQYLAIVQLQNELFQDLGEAAVKLFRRRYLDDESDPKEPLTNHAWFGRHQHAEDAGLPQMEQLLDVIFAERADLYEDMVDLQFQMSAPKDKANWMSGRLKDPLELTNIDYWMKVDTATNTQLPTLNNLKRLSIFCGTSTHRASYLNALGSHGIKMSKSYMTTFKNWSAHCSLLPGQIYNGDGETPALPFDLSEMQEAFPCSTANTHLDEKGRAVLGTLQGSCAFLGTIPGMYPQGETLEDCMWGVFYHGNSGLFVAPTHTKDLPALTSFHMEKKGDFVDKHMTGVMNILCTTDGWNNLLAPTLSMTLNIADADSWLKNNSNSDSSEKEYWNSETRALGAAIFFRMASDKALMSPAYCKKAESGMEYFHPVLTHTGSMWLPGEPSLEVFDEADRKVRFINSWADKRDTLTLKQGDGRYYHNIVRCSVCNGRVKVMLARSPTPISPLRCPHCARPGIEIDLIHWTVKT